MLTIICLCVLVAAAGPDAIGGIFGQTAAAWVQAVGSVGAIIGAVMSVNHAHQLSMRRQAVEAHRSYSSYIGNLFFLVDATYVVAKELIEDEQKSRKTFAAFPKYHPAFVPWIIARHKRLRTHRVTVETLSVALSSFDMRRVDNSILFQAYMAAVHFSKMVEPHLERTKDPAYNWATDAVELLPIAKHHAPVLLDLANQLAALFREVEARVVA